VSRRHLSSASREVSLKLSRISAQVLWPFWVVLVVVFISSSVFGCLCGRPSPQLGVGPGSPRPVKGLVTRWRRFPRWTRGSQAPDGGGRSLHRPSRIGGRAPCADQRG